MRSDLPHVLESKRAFRKTLAEKPIGEKLHIVEELAERTLATRKDTSAPLPEVPWPIPDHWRWARMGDVATIIGGSTPRTDHPEYFGGDIPWITPADLSGYTEKKILRGARNITKAGYENSGVRLLPANTVLFSSRAPIGYVAIAENPVTTNQGFKSFVLRDELLPDFVYYYLQRAKPLIAALASGTTFQEISGKNAARLPIPVPPLAEQQQIVSEIEKQFTRLDAGVAPLRRVQANLKRYRAAVLKAACEGRLVPTEAELAKAEGRTYETGQQLLTRILADRRKNWQGRGKYKEPAAPDTANIPQLPEGWAWGTAEQLTSMITDGEHITPKRAASGVYLLSARNVLDGRISLEAVDYVPQDEYERIARRLVIKPGDVLLSCSGSVGRSTIVPDGLIFTLVRSVAVLKPTLAMGRYLSLALRSPLLKNQITARQTQTAQANIFQGKIKTLCFTLPPLTEQDRIVAEVERRLSVVEELEATVSANLQRAARLRQSILQQAFSGGD